MKKYFIVMLLSLYTLNAQEIIIGIEGSNLFLLEDSSMVRIAGIDVPSENNENFLIASYAHQIKKHSLEKLFMHRVDLEYQNDYEGEGPYSYVTMFCNGEDYAEELLAMGLVKTDSAEFNKKERYEELENIARENQTGLWQYDVDLYRLAVKFDKTFYKPPVKEKKKRVVEYDRSFIRIASEVVLGPVLGIFGTFAGTALVSRVVKFNHCEFFCEDAVLTVMGIYAFMTSSAIYVIAEGGNDKLNYLSTLLYGTVPSALGMILIASSDQNFFEGTGGILMLLAPILGPIIYVNLIADFPENLPQQFPDVEVSDNSAFYKYYNSTRSINMDLLRIPLR